MPEQAQPKYMDLNKFLETFFAAQDADEYKIHYFPNMVKSNVSITNLKEQISSFASNLGPNTLELFKQYWNARNDNSAAAEDFLNMVKTITVWYAEDYGRGGLQMPAQTIMFLCNSGKIKNPKFALRLLKVVQNDLKREGYRQMYQDLSYMIAINPAAEPIDVYKFADNVASDINSKYYKNATTELLKMLNDQMVRVDAAIDAEFPDDAEFVRVPNVKNIQNSGAGTLPDIAEIILKIMQNQQTSDVYTPQDIQQVKEVVRTLKQKYSMDNILNLELGNYVQQFEDAASLKLAKMEPEYQKMEQELGATQKSQREIRRAYDEQSEEILALQDKIKKLESELRTERTKNATLRATVNTYVRDAEERANGSLVNVRKDMAEQLQNLKDYLNNNGPVKI